MIRITFSAHIWSCQQFHIYIVGLFFFHVLQKKNKANFQPSWLNKLGQQRIYYLALEEIFAYCLFCCQHTCIFVFWWKWLNTKFCFNTDSNSWWIFWSISDCGKRALRGDLEISARMQGAACFFPGRCMKASSLQFPQPLRPPSSYWKKEWRTFLPRPIRGVFWKAAPTGKKKWQSRYPQVWV